MSSLFVYCTKYFLFFYWGQVGDNIYFKCCNSNLFSFFMVEMMGIEPMSAEASSIASTSLVSLKISHKDS